MMGAKKTLRWSAVLLTTTWLTACGGGGEEAAVAANTEAPQAVEQRSVNVVEPSGPPTDVVLVYQQARQGLMHSAMVAAGARFATSQYDLVLINVGGSNPDSLAPVVAKFLADGKQVVLDSNGSIEERALIGEITAAVAGITPQEAVVSIEQTAPGAFTVTPVEVPDVGVAQAAVPSGNAPLAVLRGGKDLQ